MPLLGEVIYYVYTLIIVVLEHAKELNRDVNVTPQVWMSLGTPRYDSASMPVQAQTDVLLSRH